MDRVNGAEEFHPMIKPCFVLFEAILVHVSIDGHNQVIYRVEKTKNDVWLL